MTSTAPGAWAGAVTRIVVDVTLLTEALCEATLHPPGVAPTEQLWNDKPALAGNVAVKLEGCAQVVAAGHEARAVPSATVQVTGLVAPMHDTGPIVPPPTFGVKVCKVWA